MSVYESNYIRLKRLLGDLDRVTDMESRVSGDCPLYLKVDERSRYTVTFTLTYQFVEAGQIVSDPNLQVRVYHDARLGETLKCERWSRHPVFETLDSRMRGHEHVRNLDVRWQHNIMLNKWLEYCIDRGHGFGAAASHGLASSEELGGL